MKKPVIDWRQKMFDYYKSESPDVADYKIWEWVDETERFVKEAVERIGPPPG